MKLDFLMIKPMKYYEESSLKTQQNQCKFISGNFWISVYVSET